jgi:hypothetical protein
VGSKIRQIFRDLFGSRVIANLELQLLQLRHDFESRLHDKDLIIADLRAEKALMLGRMSIYENTIMPLASRAGAQVVAATNPTTPKKPNFAIADIMSQMPKTRWEIEQEKFYAARDAEDAEKEKQKNGTPADRS